MSRFGLYMHIPYCPAKCRYCDFYSAPGCRAVPQDYVDALLRELANCDRRPDTVYFGGGTPGLLSPAQVGRLLAAADPQAQTLGIAYSFQLVDALPSEPHDIRLTGVVCESGLVTAERGVDCG